MTCNGRLIIVLLITIWAIGISSHIAVKQTWNKLYHISALLLQTFVVKFWSQFFLLELVVLMS